MSESTFKIEIDNNLFGYEKVNEKSLFNYDGPEGETCTAMVGGNYSGIANQNSARYKWAVNLWDNMLNNTWFPKEVDMTPDAKMYKQLSKAEKRMYDLVLSQLIFMDSIQTVNISENIVGWITSPEIAQILARQAFEEALHSVSYDVMVESISENTSEIHNMWRTDEKLRAKNEYIANVYETFAIPASKGDKVAQFYMMLANQNLEGIYFYSGFCAMYALGRSGKMLSSCQMIRFIQRDEITHTAVFSNMIRTFIRENPEILTDEVIANAYTMVRTATELEIDWGKYITNNQIMNLTDDLITDFIKLLANRRWNAMKLTDALPYPEVSLKSKPIPWFDKFSEVNNIKSNFFEGNVINYSKGSIDSSDFKDSFSELDGLGKIELEVLS